MHDALGEWCRMLYSCMAVADPTHYVAVPPCRVDQPHTETAGRAICIRSGDQFQRGQFCTTLAFYGWWRVLMSR